MSEKKLQGTFLIQPRSVHVWGGAWHALAFSLSGSGAAFYSYVASLDSGGPGSVLEPLAIGLVFLGALIIFALELTYRGVFLKYFFVNLARSWISRGVTALLFFGILSVIAFLIGSFSPERESLTRILSLIAVLAALLVIIYPGLVLSSTPVPYWRTSLLPVEFLISSAAGGLAILLLVQVLGGMSAPAIPVPATLASLLAIGLLLHGIHLGQIAESTRRETIELLLRGKLRIWFIGGYMIIGVLIPVVLSVVGPSLDGAARTGVLLLAGILALLGIFSQRYGLLSAGIKPALI